MSLVDNLTDLYTREYFDARVAEEVTWSERYDRTFAIIMLGVAGFDPQDVARLLKAFCRKTDLVFRSGEHEFAILLKEADEKHARLVLDGLQEAFEQRFHRPARIGVAYFPDNGASLEELTRAATPH